MMIHRHFARQAEHFCAFWMLTTLFLRLHVLLRFLLYDHSHRYTVLIHLHQQHITLAANRACPYTQ